MTTTKDRNLLTWQSADDARVNAVRAGTGTPALIGYQPGTSEAAQPLSGDNKFAYFKDPPDNSIVYQLFGPVYASTTPVLAVLPAPNLPFAEDSPVPQIDDFVVLPELDVRPIRALALFIEYFSNAGMLEMIVEGGIRLPGFRASDQRGTKWFPLGVVNATLDASPTPNLFLPGGATRQVYSSEFRWDGQLLDVSQPIVDAIVFDVQWYSVVRIRVADVVAADSGLNVWATMGR